MGGWWSRVRGEEPALLVPSAVAAAVLVFVMATSGRGLDLMDESYVLRLVAFPDASRAAGEPYLFAFLVNPLYELVGADVALFRALGIVLVTAVAGATAHQVLGVLDRRLSALVVAAVVLTTMAASTVVFLLEVRVLSYRSIGLIGLLVVIAGLARSIRASFVSGGILTGVGGWLTFAGRPTSAAAMALLVVALLVFGRLSWRIAPWAVVGGGSAAAGTLVLAQLSPAEAADYLSNGLHLVSLLGAYDDLLAPLGLTGGHPEALIFFGVPLMAVGAAVLVWRSRVDPRSVGRADFWGSIVVVAAGGALTPLLVSLTAPSTRGFKSLALLAVVLLVGLVGMVATTADPIRPGVSPLLLVLALTPYFFALGSNRGLLTTTAQASAAWVLLGAVAWLGRRPRESWADRPVPVAVSLCMAVVVTAMATLVLYEDGADGPQLSRASHAVRVAGGTLDLRPETARIVQRLHEVASAEGLGDRAVVDLSGVGAGYAYALGGPPLGRAHLYSAWSGGVASARWALSRASCDDRERAWLIVSDDSGSDLSEAWSTDWASVRAQYDSVFAFEDERYGSTMRVEVLKPRGGRADLSCSA